MRQPPFPFPFTFTIAIPIPALSLVTAAAFFAIALATQAARADDPRPPAPAASARAPSAPAASAPSATSVEAADASDPAAAMVGRPAPAFGFPLDGFRRISLAQLLKQKKPILLSFFAWHCQPCKKGLPQIAAVARKLGAGVQVLLVHVGEDKDSAMERLLKETGAEGLPVAIDQYMAQSAKFGADRLIPRTLIIDAKGVVRAFFKDDQGDFAARLEAEILEASKG